MLTPSLHIESLIVIYIVDHDSVYLDTLDYTLELVDRASESHRQPCPNMIHSEQQSIWMHPV